MKYQKTLVIEAEQWREGQDPETYPECLRWDAERGAYVVDTLAGPLKVSDGDYIVTGMSGEIYLYKPDIFEATYEPA